MKSAPDHPPARGSPSGWIRPTADPREHRADTQECPLPSDLIQGREGGEVGANGDRKIFNDCLRDVLFNGVLRQQHVNGMEAILDFWDAPPKPPQGEFQANWDIRSIGWLDYMLATTKHETASTLQPIDEYGDAAYFTQMNENRSDVNNTAPGDGASFHGRRFVQLTGRANYTAVTGVGQSIVADALISGTTRCGKQ